MIYVLSWYVQDFLWVLGTGKVLVPEIFLMTLVFLAIYKPGSGVGILWGAFLGGIVWDLRWMGFPGITSLLYVITLMTVRWIWYSLPLSGRTVTVFGVALWCANLPISMVRIFLWGARGGAIVHAYLAQQSYILPLVLLACAAYAWRLKNTDV